MFSRRPTARHNRGRIKAGGSSAPWSPLELGAALLFWYNETSHVLSGSDVTQWSDLSGNARHGTASASRPTVGATQNGLTTVRFTGNPNAQHFTISLPAMTGGEIMLACAIDADPPPAQPQTGLYDFGTSGTNTVYPFNTNGLIYSDFGTTVRKDALAVTTDLTTWHVHDSWSEASDWGLLVNDETVHTTATNTVGFVATALLGSSQASPVIAMRGNIGEVFLASRKLTASERAAAKSYLGRWT